MPEIDLGNVRVKSSYHGTACHHNKHLVDQPSEIGHILITLQSHMLS